MIWTVAVLSSIALGWLTGHGDASLNGRTALASMPASLLTAMLGVTIGLYSRERIRLRLTYASPAVAYLGKAWFFASLSAAAAAGLSPVAWSSSCLPLFAAGAAAGVGAWLSNLPTRL